MEAVTLVVYILPAVFAASIALIVVMLFLLAKQGDERRREILDKACVSTFYVNAIENNKYDPTLSLAFRLADALGTTVDALFLWARFGGV